MFTLRTVVVTQSAQVKQRKKTADQHFIRGGGVQNGLFKFNPNKAGLFDSSFFLGRSI